MILLILSECGVFGSWSLWNVPLLWLHETSVVLLLGLFTSVCVDNIEWNGTPVKKFKLLNLLIIGLLSALAIITLSILTWNVFSSVGEEISSGGDLLAAYTTIFFATVIIAGTSTIYIFVNRASQSYFSSAYKIWISLATFFLLAYSLTSMVTTYYFTYSSSDYLFESRDSSVAAFITIEVILNLSTVFSFACLIKAVFIRGKNRSGETSNIKIINRAP